jgi:hypothetical protein
MVMPAHEFIEWQSYFNLYPFSFEVIEHSTAKLLYFIFNTAGKQFRPVKDHLVFLPEYMKEEKEIIFKPKSLEQQYAEMSGFVSKLKKFEETKTL